MLNATMQIKPAEDTVQQQLATLPTADQAEAGPNLSQLPHSKASAAVKAHSSSGDCLQPGESTHLQTNTAAADSKEDTVSTGSCTAVAGPSAYLQAKITSVAPAQRGAANASQEGSPGQQDAAPPSLASKMSVLQLTLPMSAAQQGRLEVTHPQQGNMCQDCVPISLCAATPCQPTTARAPIEVDQSISLGQ